MGMINVNPTRMELKRLKTRLTTARRGHKLLKDKRDEMMKRFLDIVRENLELRREVEKALVLANRGFAVASAVMSSEVLEQSLMFPTKTVELEVSYKNIMSVDVPEFSFAESDGQTIYPYGYAMTSGELDDAVDGLSRLMPKLLRLAETEKSAQLLAQEIEKTRRRVNALEYVMIPDLADKIKEITMKLDENERGNLTRLMKVKDMMIKEQFEKSENAV
ncbi:MAG: V-type ATP synthase subunit D [Oscillospiraceae bacterium]|nr:V-type ATP synthase subunit D [Oscillospiraceae bacterium]MBQ7120233.1 V-type ATP synthase subunit D [Oscillospiraceae bacterium]